jgi:hypothetical protein
MQEASMPEIEPTAELHEGFSQPDATARPWAEVADVLSKSEMFWLSTVRHDGRPHVTPLPAIWLDGALHFCTWSPIPVASSRPAPASSGRGSTSWSRELPFA